MISFIDENGYERFLGNQIPTKSLSDDWKIYGDTDTAPPIKRSDWVPVDDSRYVAKIADQDGIGQCNAEASVMALQVSRAKAGLPWVDLSPANLYGRINGGSDNGSLLEDAKDELMKNGVCTTSTVPRLSWRPNSWPSNWREEAKAYRLLEVYLCPTFDHIASAIQRGFTLDVGILWYSNYKVDQDGWLPERGYGVPGGHAIACVGLAQRGGKWGALCVNSWGQNWGKNGFMVIPESAFGSSIGGFWASRSITQEPGDVPSPKFGG